MKDLERDFEEMVRKNRGTIYTVCYMFSNDQDEVADFSRRCSSTFGRVCPRLMAAVTCAHGFIASV